MHVGLLQISKVGKDRSRPPHQGFGVLSEIWCTHLVGQFLKEKSRKPASVTQTDEALVVAAGVAGGDYIAQTGHCGFAYNRHCQRFEDSCSKHVLVPQPYIVTIPSETTRLL